MNEYIILTDTPECDLVKSYTNEYCYIQEGILDDAIGKGKQESMLWKILAFLPRLVFSIGRFILTKLANTKLGSKIKLLQRWCDTPDSNTSNSSDQDYDYSDDWDEEDLLAAEESTVESYVIESKFNVANPTDYIPETNNRVDVSSFKKINALSITFVNLCDEMPGIVDKLVELSLTITDVMDRVYNDALKNGAVDLAEQQHRNDVRNRVKSYISNRENMEGLTDKQKEELIRKRVNDMKVKKPQGSIRTTSNPLQSNSMKILGGYANPFDPKWEKYFLAADVKPYDVQRECTKIEKIIGEHTIKVSKLYEEFNKVILTVNKDNLKVSKPHTLAINPNKKDVSDALQYINSIRRNMLYSAKRLDVCAKRLEQMNPERYKNKVMDVTYLIKDYKMMYTDCTKLSNISRLIVNQLVDTIDEIIRITGNSESAIYSHAEKRANEDAVLREKRQRKLNDHLTRISEQLKNDPNNPKLNHDIERLMKLLDLDRAGVSIYKSRRDAYNRRLHNSTDPYGTNRLKDYID